MPEAIPLIVGAAAQGIALEGFGIALGTFTSAAIGGIASFASSNVLGSRSQ